MLERMVPGRQCMKNETHAGGAMVGIRVKGANSCQGQASAEGMEFPAELNGQEVKVGIPDSFYKDLLLPGEDLFLVVSGFSGEMRSADVLREAKGVLNIKFYGMGTSSRAINVTGLKEPLRFTLPVTNHSDLVCAVFKDGKWSTEGVSTVPTSPDKPLECLTTHLSTFGAVPRKELLIVTVDSGHDLGSIVLACVACVFAYLFVCAACADFRHTRAGWSLQLFLIPSDTSSGDSPQQISGVVPVLLHTMAKGSVKAIVAFARELFFPVQGLAFIFSFVTRRRLDGSALSFAKGIFLGHAQRVAATALGLGNDLVSYVLTAEDILETCRSEVDLLWSAAQQENECVEQFGDIAPMGRKELWAKLYVTVYRKKLNALQGACSTNDKARIFRAQNPLTSYLSFSMLTPRKMEVMVHAAYFLSSVLLTSCILEAAGLLDESSVTGWVVPIALAAGTASRLVLLLLKSLRSIRIQSVEHDGCPESRFQLRLWRALDMATYGLALGFICAGFLAPIFILAEASATGHAAFAWAVLVLAIQDFLLRPAQSAAVQPVLAEWFLAYAGKAAGLSKEDYLGQMDSISTHVVRVL